MADDLIVDMRSRVRWLTLLKNPKFARRVKNPRNAAKYDLIKVTVQRKSGPYSFVAFLPHDPEDFTDSEGRQVTEYMVGPIPFPYKNETYCFKCQGIPDSGFGKFKWHEVPKTDFGVQKVEVVGTLSNKDFYF